MTARTPNSAVPLAAQSREEPDPLNQKFGALSYHAASSGADDPDDAGEFCPFCGAKLGEGFLYCRKCGKKLPE